MSDQSRVFIGLLRPPKLMGLPIMYAMVWLFGSTLLFLWVQSWVVAVFAGLAWPALWKAADWDPNFLDVRGLLPDGAKSYAKPFSATCTRR